MNLNSLSLYTVCGIIVVFCLMLFAVAYVIGRYLWDERKANKRREAIRHQQKAENLLRQRYKYAVYPGYVHSINDGDRHYIGADRLIQLYGVNRRDCLIIREHERGANGEGLIPLRPRFDGNYSLPES